MIFSLRLFEFSSWKGEKRLGLSPGLESLAIACGRKAFCAFGLAGGHFRQKALFTVIKIAGKIVVAGVTGILGNIQRFAHVRVKAF